MWDEHLFLTRQRRKQRGVEFEHVRRPWTRFLLGDRKLMRDHPGQQCELEALFQLPFEREQIAFVRFTPVPRSGRTIRREVS